VKIVFQLKKLNAQKTENYDNSTHTTNRPVGFAHHLIPLGTGAVQRAFARKYVLPLLLVVLAVLPALGI
jgi:hypothetical protein